MFSVLMYTHTSKRQAASHSDARALESRDCGVFFFYVCKFHGVCVCIYVYLRGKKLFTDMPVRSNLEITVCLRRV